MKLKQILLFIFIVEVIFSINAQKQFEKDSVLFQELNQSFQTLVYKDIDSSLLIANQQGSLIQVWKNKKQNFNNIEELYFNNMGVYHKMKSNFDSSIYYYEQCIALFETKDDKYNVATIYNNIGNIHYMKGDYPFSLDFHLKSLNIRNEIYDTTGIAMSNANIGLIFESQNETEKAITYFNKAAEGFELLKNQRAISWTYSSLGISYTNTKQYELADSLLNLSLAIRTKLDDNRGKEFCYSSLAILYLQKAKDNNHSETIKKAKEYALHADALSKINGDKWGNISTLNTLGELHLLELNTPLAMPCLTEAKNYAIEIESAKELGKTYELLSLAHEQYQQFDSALFYYKSFKAINDSLFNIEKDKEIGRKEAWLDYQKELDIYNIKKENKIHIHKGEKKIQQLISVIIGLSFILVLIGLIYIYRKWQKTKEEKLAIELEKLRIEKLNIVLADEIKTIKDKLENRKEELPPHMDKLSKREMEVLILLGKGHSDKEIGENLFISITTVRTHNRKIFEKLQIKNRTEALTILNKYKLT